MKTKFDTQTGSSNLRIYKLVNILLYVLLILVIIFIAFVV